MQACTVYTLCGGSLCYGSALQPKEQRPEEKPPYSTSPPNPNFNLNFHNNNNNRMYNQPQLHPHQQKHHGKIACAVERKLLSPGTSTQLSLPLRLDKRNPTTNMSPSSVKSVGGISRSGKLAAQEQSPTTPRTVAAQGQSPTTMAAKVQYPASSGMITKGSMTAHGQSPIKMAAQVQSPTSKPAKEQHNHTPKSNEVPKLVQSKRKSGLVLSALERKPPWHSLERKPPWHPLQRKPPWKPPWITPVLMDTELLYVTYKNHKLYGSCSTPSALRTSLRSRGSVMENGI